MPKWTGPKHAPLSERRKRAIFIDDSDEAADWIKATWDLPLTTQGFLQYLADRAGANLNDDIAKEWLRFKTLPIYQVMPQELRSSVVRALQSGTSGPSR